MAAMGRQPARAEGKSLKQIKMAHGHSHGSACCHDHDHDSEDPAVLFTLYQKIDLENVQCLNEEKEGSGKLVFKSWDNRLDREMYVESDVDEELLFYVPFTGDVKLKAIRLCGGDEGAHPAELRLFKNRPPLGFDELQGEPEQTLQLVQDHDASVEYKVKQTKFTSVQSLLMHFPKNFGASNTTIYYIGLQGEFSKVKSLSTGHRHGVTICTYEARANPADHKAGDVNLSGNIIS